ncbi:hypothetical protein [Paraburkholderia dioscoreae]|uniref:hypothetical protein n=1 Tax=Paraburkholderia dioscoreae TaxID=2604047 RepID=UPI0013EB855C|nr:hypothetical protein [Paraburkholderia dioscoreae]
MANANLKPRRTRAEECTRISVVLEQAAPSDALHDHRKRVAFPWMQITDTMLEFAGFRPGQHVFLSIDHRCGRITIGVDRDYTIAGKPMTKQQIMQRSKRMSD